MIDNHNFYEEQSALAATGQLTTTELADLETHAMDCASCRYCIAEMAETSRNVFLWQATRTKRRKAPAGMQERFMERAAGMGISVRRHPVPSNSHFGRIAGLAVLLAIATALGWETYSVRDTYRRIAPAEPSARLQSLNANEISHASYVPSKRNTQPRSRLAGRLVAVASSRPSIVTQSPSYFEPERLRFVRQGSPMRFLDAYPFWSQTTAAGLLEGERQPHTLTALSTTCIASFLKPAGDCHPGKRAFHLDLRVASSALLNPPQSIDEEANIPNFKFTAPAFSIEPARAR